MNHPEIAAAVARQRMRDLVRDAERHRGLSRLRKRRG